MSIRVTVSGANRTPLRAFSFTSASSRWAAVVGPAVQDALKRAAPVGKGAGAGRLRDSIRYEHRVGGGSARLTFTANTPYARFVLHGTGPHIIRPRKARALRWQGSGGTRFARVVHHPGTKPNPFPERAIRPLLPLIQRRYREIVQSSLRG